METPLHYLVEALDCDRTLVILASLPARDPQGTANTHRVTAFRCVDRRVAAAAAGSITAAVERTLVQLHDAAKRLQQPVDTVARAAAMGIAPIRASASSSPFSSGRSSPSLPGTRLATVQGEG